MNEETRKSTPKEEVLIQRSVLQRQETANKIEQVAKIISLVAIPVVIAAFGWVIQNALSQKTLGKDYVQLAVSILMEKPDSVDPSLREWAVDLLNDNSPTRFSTEVARKLKTGEVRLPEALSESLAASVGGTIAVSPDGHTISTTHEDGIIRLWDLETGRCTGTLVGHEAAVTCTAFSPDGSLLISGSMDQTARLWNLDQMRVLGIMHAHQDGVIGVGICPDGRTAVTRSLDGTLVVWDSLTGRMLRRLRLGN